MEANSKLQKKKRIAHSQLSKSNLNEPKLPPDDFVYNIMKDMDSSNIISYQLSQEIKSKDRQDSCKHKGRKLKNSTNHDSYCKKQKRMLPKKSFPLMKKCQTSLKYLNKNRCIPKPRAHVGFAPKPQVQPVTFAKQTISKYDNEKHRKSVKNTKIQSKAYSQVIESNLIRNSNAKSQQNKTTENDNLVTEEDNGFNGSSSEDGDDAFESFIKKVNEENDISTDSSSDSRVIIRRKKSKSKPKREKHKNQSFSNDRINKCISKVTSIPLSDSSESEQETSEVNERLKQNMVLPTRLHERVCTDPLESYQSDSSLDQLPDLNTYNSSSDEDFDDQAEATKTNIESSTNCSETSIPALGEANLKVSSFEPDLGTTALANRRLDKNVSNPIESLTVANQCTIDKNNEDILESNEVISFNSLIATKEKNQVPCCVKLKRDPILDKKALTYSSAFDCVVISDESDNEVSTSSINETRSVSNETRSVSTKNTQHVTDVHESLCNSDFDNFKDDADDCIIMCEMPILPQVGSSSNTTLNLDSVHCSPKPTSSITVDEDRTSTEIDTEVSSNSGKAAAHVSCESTSANKQEFKVQIVAVESLVEHGDNSLKAKAAEANEIEIIDLSDDDLNSEEIGSENKHFEAVKELGTEQHIKEIQLNGNEFVPFISNEQNIDYQTPLSNPVQQSSCEETPVQVQNVSNLKILETLSKIDFDSIKEIINKTKSFNMEEASTEEEMLMTNVEHHILNSEGDLPNSTDEKLSKTDATVQSIKSAITSSCDISNNIAIEPASKANPLKSIPALNAVAGEATFTAKLYTEPKNQDIYIEEKTTSNILNVNNIGQQSDETNLQNTTEKQLISVAIDSQLNFVKQMKVQETQTIIDKEKSECFPRTICDGKRRNTAIDDGPNNKKLKCEIFESPSDELDVIAASFAKDLSTPNKTVDALLNLYKAEYAKYVNIINTEANVTLGLQMLHNKQLDKLTHLRSSIKNLVKHDPCYHTAIQDKYDIKPKVWIGNDAKLNQKMLIPSSSSERSEFYIPSYTNEVEVKHAISSKESGSEIAIHPKSTTKLKVKLDSSEERKDGIPAQYEVKAEPSVKTTPDDKFKKFMRDIKCAECGKPATARCQGCAQVFYCSSQCGELSWNKGHNVACKRSRK